METKKDHVGGVSAPHVETIHVDAETQTDATDVSFLKKYHTDPEYRKQCIEKTSTYIKVRRAHDPQYDEKCKETMRECAKKYYENPENRAKKNAYGREWYRKKKEKERALQLQQDVVNCI